MPIKVLIIEDELIIREHLYQLLDWKEEGFVVVGEATNGANGLQMVGKYQPDIVLLDIKMPHMDGIEFMMRLKEMQTDVKIIILSSYDDFTYASHAIDYGVVDYILKHQLTKEKLCSSLKKAVGMISAERQREMELKNLKTNLENVVDIRKELLLREIICGVTQERYRQIQEVAPLNLASNDIFVVVVERYQKDTGMHKQNPYEAIWMSLFEKISLLLKKYNGGEVCSISANLACVMINDIKSNSMLHKKNMLHKLLKSMRQAIGELVHDRFGIYVAQPVKGVLGIHGAVERISAMIPYRVFYEGDPLIYQHELEKLEPVDPEKLEVAFLLLTDAVQISEKEFFFETLDTLFQLIAEKMDLEAYKRYSNKLLSFAKALEIDYNLTLKGVDETFAPQSIRDAKENFRAIFTEFFNAMSEKESYSNQVVLNTIKFIRDNYKEALDLNIIANDVNVSRTYLSALFKQKTGTNLTEYLTSFRIEKAKELIHSSDARVYEIAAAVGIPDTKYFCKLFKKYTGFTPTKYKTI